MKYYIHDNGGRPFCVDVFEENKKLVIYTLEYDEEKECGEISKCIYETKYEKLYFGESNHGSDNSNKGDNWVKGCSILVHVKSNEYICIGMEIYSFKTINNEEIKRYFSPIYGSDVVYNYAVGEYNTYLLLEKVYINNNDINVEQDVYTQYYAYHRYSIKDNIIKNKLTPPKKIKGHKMPIKIIHERRW